MKVLSAIIEKKMGYRLWQDSNLQSSAPEADALSIRPQKPMNSSSFSGVYVPIVKKTVSLCTWRAEICIIHRSAPHPGVPLTEMRS